MEDALEKFSRDGSVLRFSLQQGEKTQQFEMLYLEAESDEELEEAARSPDPRRRFAAIYRIAQNPKPRFLDVLLAAARDRGFVGRGAAIIALAKLAKASSTARKAVIAALYSGDYLLTLSALQGMGFLCGFWVRRRLRRVLRHLMRQPLDRTPASIARGFLATAAAESLIKCRDLSAAAHLHQLLQHPDPHIKTQALSVLARHPEVADIQKVAPLSKQSPPVSIPALEILAKKGNEDALEDIIAYAESPEGGVRAQAFAALLNIGSQKALDAAQNLLIREKDPLLRAQVALRLINAGRKVSADILSPLLSHNSPVVRQGAILALAQCDGGDEILQRHLEREPDEILRRLIEKQLARKE